MNAALLILRLVLGTAMAAHGAQRLFGWFGGDRLPRIRLARAVGLAEFLSGLLLALGFLGPLGPALMISVMLIAILRVRKGRTFFNTNAVELPILYIAGALAVIFAGPGQYSLDHVVGLDSISPHVTTWVTVAFGVLGGLGNLAVGD